jgi:hypothetical protein
MTRPLFILRGNGNPCAYRHKFEALLAMRKAAEQWKVFASDRPCIRPTYTIERGGFVILEARP